MKRWYAIQVYAGYEETIKAELKKRIEEEGLSSLFGEILIPAAKLKPKQILDEQFEKEQQLFPGYLFVEMESVPEAIRLVTTTNRVIRPLGGKEPVPLSAKEIDRIKSQIEGKVEVAQKKSEFVIGNEVEISQGPFAGFVGIIDSVHDEAEKLTVMVSIFGRMTPVELGFDHVRR